MQFDIQLVQLKRNLQWWLQNLTNQCQYHQEVKPVTLCELTIKDGFSLLQSSSASVPSTMQSLPVMPAPIPAPVTPAPVPALVIPAPVLSPSADGSWCTNSSCYGQVQRKNQEGSYVDLGKLH